MQKCVQFHISFQTQIIKFLLELILRVRARTKFQQHGHQTSREVVSLNPKVLVRRGYGQKCMFDEPTCAKRIPNFQCSCSIPKPHSNGSVCSTQTEYFIKSLCVT